MTKTHEKTKISRVLLVNNKALRDRGAQKTLRFLTFLALIYNEIK